MYKDWIDQSWKRWPRQLQMVIQLTPATQHLDGGLYFFAQPQLTSCFSGLEMNGLDIQSGCHRLETICQPQCDGSGIAGCGMSYSNRVLLVWSLKNVMMECITAWRQVVEIWSCKQQRINAPSSVPRQKMLKSPFKPDSLHSLRQDVCHGHLCPYYGVVGPALTLSPSPQATNAIDGALPAW